MEIASAATLRDSYDRPCSLVEIVWVASCFFLPKRGLISMSAIKTRAVIRHRAPSTAALSIRSSGTLSIEAIDRAPTMPNRITPTPNKSTSFNITKL